MIPPSVTEVPLVDYPYTASPNDVLGAILILSVLVVALFAFQVFWYVKRRQP